MLLYRRHGRNAFQQDPEKEARLLCMSFDPKKRIGSMTGEEYAEMMVEVEKRKMEQMTLSEEIRADARQYGERMRVLITEGTLSLTAKPADEKQAAERYITDLSLRSPKKAAIYDAQIRDATTKEVRDSYVGIVTGMNEQFQQAIDEKRASLIEEFKALPQTQENPEPEAAVDDFLASKIKSAEKDIITTDRAMFIAGAEEMRKQFLLEECKTFSKNFADRTKTPSQIIDEFKTTGRAKTALEIALIDGSRDSFESTAETERKEILLQEIAVYAKQNDYMDPADIVRSFGINKSPAEKQIIEHARPSFVEKAGNVDDVKVVPLKSSAEAKKNCDKLLETFNSLQENIDNVLARLKKFPSSKEIQKKQKELRELRGELGSQTGAVHTAIETSNMIAQWKAGVIPPVTFLNWLENQRTIDGVTDPRIAAARTYIQSTAGKAACDDAGLADMTTEAAWDSPAYQQYSNRYTAVAAIENYVDTQVELNGINTFIDRLNGTLSEHNVTGEVEELLNTLKELEKKSIRHGEGAVIEWASLMERYQAWKGWWEDYTGAWSDASKLRVSRVEYKVAESMRWLPKGEAAVGNASQKLNSQHRKRRGELKEDIDNNTPPFKELFGPGKAFRNAIGDTDAAMAVLEHAAGRGLLYTLQNDYLVDGFDLLHTPGVFPAHWDERAKDIWLDNLLGTQASGYNKVKKDTNDTIHNKYTKQKYFLKEFDSYLENINLPAAQGVMEALLDRAIDGDEDGKLAAHFFRALRKYPEIRKNLTPSVIQDFSRATAGNLFMDRDKIAAEAEKGKEFDMKKAGNLPRAISIAEDKIRAMQSGISDEQLDTYIAAFLLGKPVRIGNQSLSIWDKEFNFYRSDETNIAMRFTKADGVKNTANDYFDSGDTYELLLTNEAFITEVFRTGSPMKWENPDKARAFVGKVYKAYTDLIEQNKGIVFANTKDHPAERMREEVGEKIQKAMQSSIRQSDQLKKVRLTIGGQEQPIDAVAALQIMGFIRLEDMGKFGIELLRGIEQDIELTDKILVPMKPGVKLKAPADPITRPASGGSATGGTTAPAPTLAP
jgi:hypothetical protein